MRPLDPGVVEDATYEDPTFDDGAPATQQLRCGPWRMGPLIGQGGAGIVYEATHEHTGAVAALKVLCMTGRLSPTQGRRFAREVAVQRSLSDPGVVRVLDAGTSPEGEAWVAMERLHESLAIRLARDEPMTARQIATLVRDVARTLDRLHHKGVVHRDVKPGNILLTVDGAPRLADFGLVVLEEATSTLTRVGARPGTPRYMAPEQKADAVAEWPLVDVHALGRVLDELVGRLRTGPWSLSAGATSDALPVDLLWIAHRATDPDPALRTRSCAALADDLDRWLDGRPVRTRPLVMAARASRWLWRHRALSLASVLAVVSVGVAVGQPLVDQIQLDRSERDAAARWARLRPLLTDGSGDEFARFVEDPALAGRAVLSDAWLWRARGATGDDRARFAARATRLARTETQRTTALGVLAETYFDAGDWSRLARLQPLLPADPVRARWLRMAAFDHPPAPELEPFRTGRLLTRVDRVGLAGAQVSPPETVRLESGVDLVVGSYWHNQAGLGLQDDLLRAVPYPEAFPELDFPPHANRCVSNGERVWMSSIDQRTILHAIQAGPDPSVWPDLDRLHSYGAPPEVGDVDADGLDEIIQPLGQPYGYGFAIVELDEHGEATGARVHRTGATQSTRILHTAVGPRLAVSAHAFYESEALFGHGIGGDGGPRVMLYTVRDGAVVLEQTVDLPPFVWGMDRSMAADLDGDGDDELVLAAIRQEEGRGSSHITDTFVFTTDQGRLREPWYLPNTSVGTTAQLDDDPALELVGSYSVDLIDRDVYVFGVGGPLPELVQPDLQDPSQLLLESLGQFEEAALAHEAAGDFASAAVAWASAGDLTAASLAAEAAGDTDSARDLAARDLDFARAVQLGLEDPRLPVGAPTATLTPTALLEHRGWFREGSVGPDVLSGGTTIDGVRGMGPVLEWPLVATGPSASLDITLDLTWAEWDSQVLVELVDEAEVVRARVDLHGVGSGGRLYHLVKAPDIKDRVRVDALDATERLRVQLTPWGSALERQGARVVATDEPSFEVEEGERLTLRVSSPAGLGARARVVLRQVDAWGFVVDGAAPETTFEPPDALAAVRLGESPDDATWGAVWTFVATSHPTHPELLVELDSLDTRAGLSVDDEARLRVVRGRARIRMGRIDAAEADLDATLVLTGTDPDLWTPHRDALALKARLALLRGDTDAATRLAEAALDATPDRDLGRRLLARDAEVYALVAE